MSAPAPVRPRLLQRPVSAAQRESARRNGLKSRGPVSAQGKAQSSANARTHGLFAVAHTRLPTLAAFKVLLWNDALHHAHRGPHRTAHAFESLADSRVFQALGRTESDCLRRAREAARTFLASRSHPLPGLARVMGPERTLELVDSTVNQPRSRTPPELPVRIEECLRSF